MTRTRTGIVLLVVLVVVTVAAATLLREGSGSEEVEATDPASCSPVAVVEAETASRQSDAFRLRGDGSLEPLTADRRSLDPAVAPDGTWLVYTQAASGSHSETTGYGETRLRTMATNGDPSADIPGESGWNDSDAAVSPDGRRIAFLRKERSGERTRLVAAERTGENQEVVAELGVTAVAAPAWSPDAKTLAVAGMDRMSGEGNLVLVAISDGNVRTLSIDGAGRVAWSPDGSRIVVSGHRYEAAFDPFEVEVRSGATHKLEAPQGANWTSAQYASGSADQFRVLRFEQTTKLVPQHIELVRDGRVASSVEIETLPQHDGDGRVLVSSLSTSHCFAPDED